MSEKQSIWKGTVEPSPITLQDILQVMKITMTEEYWEKEHLKAIQRKPEVIVVDQITFDVLNREFQHKPRGVGATCKIGPGCDGYC